MLTRKYAFMSPSSHLMGAFALVVLLLCSSALAEDRENNSISVSPVAAFEGGHLFQLGSLKVLELHGSYREMGRQYGYLLKDDLNQIYDNMSRDFGNSEAPTRDHLLAFGNRSFQLYPQRYKEIILGMAETSGLELNDLLVINCLQIYLLSAHGCSAMAVWGNYTSNGPLVFGRNYDWSDKMRQYIVVVVFNPEDGSIPVASVHYTGSIYLNTGINQRGIFLETNGDTSESIFTMNTVTTPILLLTFLEDSASLEEIDGRIRSARPSDGCIVNVADEREARSYEWTPFDLKRRTLDKDGLLVSTNHFQNPEWGFETPVPGINDPIRTEERSRNLISLAQMQKGKLTPDIMMDIMSRPLSEGGALQTEELPTSYQVVAVPEDLKIYVRIPGVQDWTIVDLNLFFQEEGEAGLSGHQL
ncbi:MAG: C45 family autoproteolytic acyltransferase/hydrolase [Methanothrix sp.]